MLLRLGHSLLAGWCAATGAWLLDLSLHRAILCGTIVFAAAFAARVHANADW